jgi:hypothetical protein
MGRPKSISDDALSSGNASAILTPCALSEIFITASVDRFGTLHAGELVTVETKIKDR